VPAGRQSTWSTTGCLTGCPTGCLTGCLTGFPGGEGEPCFHVPILTMGC